MRSGKILRSIGPNVLPEAVPRSGWSILLGQLTSLPVVLLGCAAALSIFTGGIADALVIAGVVAINAVIGYVTESGTEKTINALKGLVRPSALVLREGKIREINSADVVVGDIIVLRPGSYVPADGRLIEAEHLSVDESTLTGESMPVQKIVDLLSEERAPVAERINMVYAGTLVTGGQGMAVIVGSGRFTEMGRIQMLLAVSASPETPMERKLDQIGRQLVLIGGGICGLVFVIGLLRGYGFLQMLKTSVSLAVAAVPEGLPTVATTTLALGIRNMRRHNVLIRHLEAVETLGSVQTICLDKTGTLTENRMSVREIFTGNRLFTVEDGEFRSGGSYADPYSPDLLKLIRISVLCNESVVVRQNGKSVVTGTPTENAFIHVAIAIGLEIEDLKHKFPVEKIVHRAENRNTMLTVHSVEGGPGHIIAAKGSPREILSKCQWHLKNGRKLKLTQSMRQQIELENENMAGKAYRVLGVAFSEERRRKNGGNNLLGREDLVWLGLVGIADPLRRGVKELIGNFHAAGIGTVMITGDQSPTAYAIAKEVDLSKGEQLEILDSRQLSDLPPDVLKALCERVHVFARVSPSHKLQIVQSLQGAGRVVAMTGDGINDGPALKAADIGIAMGHTGTDVAREVADVILEDDKLETMIIAVSQGRTIYNNIRKSLHFLLSTNMSEIIVMFTAITFGLGQPLNAMQLLWINLVSDIFPGLALALEPPEPDVLARPPLDPQEPVIRSSDFKRIAFESTVISAGSMGAYVYGIARYGVGPRAGTLAFLSLTLGQLLHSLSCRSEHAGIFSNRRLPSNRYLNLALGGSLAIQALAFAIPSIRGLLGITAIGIADTIAIGLGASVPLLVNEMTKDQELSTIENTRMTPISEYAV
jgi:P-type Ca2+ transporter type 2C